MANTDTANANANAMRGATSANDPSPNGLGPADVPGGESGYEPWYPSNVATGSSVRAFISRFYQISDDSGRDEEWVNCFDAGATVMIGNEVANGKQEIRKLRRRMWKDVEARKHRVVKVFPGNFSAEVASMHEAEYMLFGAVAYRMKDGKGDAVAGWAGHAQLKRDSVTAPWRMVFYRVYLQQTEPKK